MIEDINVKRCTCDICKYSQDIIGHKPNPLRTLILPVDYCDEYGNFEHLTNGEIEVCKSCFEEIYTVLSNHYKLKLIKYGGLAIEKKGGEG
jgi:hypothetical protein